MIEQLERPFQALSTRQYAIVDVEVRGYGTMSAKQGIVAVRRTYYGHGVREYLALRGPAPLMLC